MPIFLSQIKDIYDIPTYLNRLGQLNIEDNNVVLNYNPSGSTTGTSIGGGITIQDGDGIDSDVTFRIGALNTLSDSDLNISEYTDNKGYKNLGFFTELNDIVLSNTDTGTTDGVRVIKEKDVINGGTINNEVSDSETNRSVKFLVKSSKVSGTKPEVSDLLPGELMINVCDGILYTLKGEPGSYEVIKFNGTSVEEPESIQIKYTVNDVDLSELNHTQLDELRSVIKTSFSTELSVDLNLIQVILTQGSLIAKVIILTPEDKSISLSEMQQKLNDATTIINDTKILIIDKIKDEIGKDVTVSEPITETYPTTPEEPEEPEEPQEPEEPEEPTYYNQNETLTLPEGDSQKWHYPAYGLYDYSHTMYIIRASELGGGNKLISGLEIELAGYGSYTYENQTIKLAHTTDLEFGSSVKVDLTNINNVTNLTTVKSGFNFNATGSGYKAINFDTDFEYNGTDSLLIIWENRDGDWDSGFGYAVSHFDNEYASSWYEYTDDSYPSSYGTKDQSYRPNFKIKY